MTVAVRNCLLAPSELTDRLSATNAAIAHRTDASLRDVTVQSDVLAEYRVDAGERFDELIERLRVMVARPPHFAILRRLPPAHPLLLVAVGRALGVCAEPYRQPWSVVVRHIEACKEAPRGSNANLNENLHTDGTDWPVPNNLTLLMCARPDQLGGGNSLLLDRASVEDAIQEDAGTAALRLLLDRDVPWKLADTLGGRIHHEPVLGPNRMRWLRHTVLTAVQAGAELDAALRAAVDALQVAVQRPGRAHETALAPGDILVVDNTRCLHGRTAITTGERSERLLFRVKVAAEPPRGSTA